MAVEEKVIVDVETKEKGTESTADKFSKLQTRIRETRIELQKAAEAGDQVQFNKLRADLDDLEDQLAATTIRSKNLTDTLSQIPGPLGDIAAQTGGALDQLKAFSNLTLSDLRTSVADFSQDLNTAFTTIGRVTGITKVYTVLNNALSASFIRLGLAEGTAAAGARAFAAALTATGIGAIIVGVGALVALFIQLSNAEENATVAADAYIESLNKQKEALDDLIDSRNTATNIEIARLKQAGATEDQINKVRLKNAENDLTLRKQAVDFIDQDLKKKNEELIVLEDQSKLRKVLSNTAGKEVGLRQELKKLDEARIDAVKNQQSAELNLENIKADIAERDRAREQEATDTILQQGQARKQQRLKDLEDISAAQRDAFLVTLEEQDAEEYAINEKYTILIGQAIRYGKDTTLLEEARLIELDKIRQKYTDKEKKSNEDKAKDILKRLEEFNKEEYDKELNALETRYALGLMLESQYQDALFNIKAKYAETDKELRDAELESLKFFMSQVKDYGKQYEAINAEIVQSYISLGENIATVFGRTAQLFEQGSTAAKVFGVLSVVANAASGIAQVIIKNQETQAAYNKTIGEGTAAIASGTIKLTNPLTAPLGVAELAAGKAAIATSIAGKASSRLNAGIQIGTIGATSAAQIAAILSAKKSDASVKTSGAGAGGSGGTTITGPAIGAPQVGAGAFAQQGTIAGIVAGAIQGGQSGGRPIRAYVVGNEITTQQQLERRIRAAARLGG